MLEGLYTRLLEQALRVHVVRPGSPPGASGGREESGSGGATPGTSGAGAPDKPGEQAPAASGAAAPGDTRALESPPPEKEGGGTTSKGRGLPPLARLRKRDRRDEGDQLVETKVKEEQPVDKSEPLVDVKENRHDKKKEKERESKHRTSKEGREEDRRRKRSRERERTRRSRSRSRKRDRRRRERTPPKTPSPCAESLQEGGESEERSPQAQGTPRATSWLRERPVERIKLG